MDREIKFRAWDDWDMVYSKPMPDFSFWKWSGYSSNTMIMQYTWLKDKINDEMREWDKVEIDIREDKTDKYTKAKWIVIRSEIYSWWSVLFSEGNELRLSSIALMNRKVIGNIYESPDKAI